MGRDSELISLIKAGNTEGVKKFLVRLRKSGSGKKLATINSQNEEGLSALHLCALQNLKELLEDLVELKASVNLKDNRGLTPLHYTAFRGNLEAAVSLMDSQANPCAVANNGETPLHVAAQYGHANVMSVLLDYQANPLISNNTVQTPLDIACFMGHTKAVKVLLDTGCFPSKQYGAHSLIQSPIHLCAKQGHTEILKMLVEVGFSVDDMGPNGTPLHEAALYGRVDVVKLLIQMRCDQNLKNSQSQTAMDLVHKFTNPRAYTSRQILQALSQARPVSIPRPPSFTMSNMNLNPPPSPSLSSHSFHSLPDNQHPAHSDSGSMDTPVRDRNADFHPQEAEPEPELLVSPLPTYNEYEAAGDANGFASMIAQAAVLRKNTLTNPSRKISNNYIPPIHQHVPSDPMDRLACVKSSKRESFSNSSTDTSFSFNSNSGFSTGVSTPDRYQSPSPANLLPATQAQMPQQYRQAFQAELPSNDTYDMPDDYQLNQPTSRVGDITVVHNIYDTPSSIPRPTEFAPQGDARYAPKPPRPTPADIARSNTDNSMVLRKLTLPAGFNNLSTTQQQPIYDNQTTPDEILPPNYLSQQPLPAFQAPHPVDSMELPPRPLSKPRILAKPGLGGAVNTEEKQHLSELQMKLSMRKKVSETSLKLPPAPPSTSPPPMATQSDIPPQKPPREIRTHLVSPPPRSPSPPLEERGASPEVESQFLEALKLRKGSLKRTEKIAPFIPPQSIHTNPIPPQSVVNNQIPPQPVTTNQIPPQPIVTNQIPPQPIVTNQIPPQSIVTNQIPPQSAMAHPSPPKPVMTSPCPPQPVLTNQIPPQPLFKNPKPPPSISTNPGPSIPEVSPLETESREPRRERAGTIISKISPSVSWPLDKFLSALKLSEYLATLAEAGYAESADFVGLTADDVAAAGIAKAGHRKKLLTSIQSLTARHAGFDHIPSSIESWLTQWHLLGHQDTLVDSGYDDLEFIADMTRDELRELGIQKVPVLNRFAQALSHLHACIQTHRSVVLSASPQVTPQKNSSSVKHSQQPNPAQECAKPPVAKHPADFTPPPAYTRNSPHKVNANNAPPVNRETFTRANTQDESTPPTDNFTPHAPLSKAISNPPSVLRKPTLPPPVSRKPPPQRRHSKHLNSPDQPASPTQLTSPSPDQLISPSPNQLISPSPNQLISPSPNQLISPSPNQLISPSPNQLGGLPSPDAMVGLDDLPPPPLALRSSVYGDFQDDLPPPPQEMSSLGAEANFTPPHIPPHPHVAITPVSRFLTAEASERHKRISGISDLDDILNSMGSEATTPPEMPTHTPTIQRPIQSSDVLEDIDAMLANLNLEIDSIISDA